MTATRSFYEDQAEQYAALTLNLSMAPELSRFRALCPAGRIVDLGCGAGRDLRYLRNAGRDAIGLDLSEPLAITARSVSGAQVVVADLRRTPFATAAFAGAWASASLLHLSRGQVALALSETARTLQPQGILFTSVKAGRGERRSKDGRRFVLHSAEKWGRMVEAAGFQLIVLDTVAGASTARASPETWINCLAMRL
jgi:SAM-dependent methyltransferase